MTAEMDIEEGGSTVTGHYAATTSGLMRIDVYAQGTRVWSEGLDHDGAWNWPQDKPPSPEAPAAEAALRHSAQFNLFGLHRLSSLGAHLELVDYETIKGTRYYVIRTVLADGFETFFYVDPNSWMITRRRDVRALHPDADPHTKLLESEFADFRPVNGVQTSFRSTQSDVTAGKLLQTTLVRATAYNPVLNRKQFSRTFTPVY
jgi:hypothetical protein